MSNVDPNLVVPTKLEKDDIKFYDVLEAPFQVYGVYYEDGALRRMPEAVAKTVSPGVLRLHWHTAGGRVRFRTDSPYIAVSVRLCNTNLYSHFSTVGSAGLDMYYEDEGRFFKSFIPPREVGDHYEYLIERKEDTMRDILINMPLYSGVVSLHIGLAEGAQLLPPKPLKCDKKVVFYGSSITQGGCASRPGNSYEATVSRRFGFDYVNLGFSGNACAEDEIIAYIAGLDMDVFVYDYDHNARTLPHLENTHEKMFRAIRAAHPNIPIVMMCRPKYYVNKETARRIEIISATYNNAKAAGDHNVYLLTGPELMALCGEDGLVDGTHPNDFGFASMAKAVGDLFEREGFFKD